ncbi:hypothetical protein [Corallococcus sicarius]|uniref:hypothetical protein n=1 Tax=Corallococcus sicarius TaxID=2316726 RepID=UPI001FC92D5C|nr:hypothetical protein [Corallococcus sicarius]
MTPPPVHPAQLLVEPGFGFILSGALATAAGATFHRGMSSLSDLENGPIARGDDFSACRQVVDTVIPPGCAPHGGKVLDVMMLASLPGRERTEEDFRKLFAQAGLRLSRVIPTPAALSITEAVAA